MNIVKRIKDSFIWYYLDYHVFGFVKYTIQEPRFWRGFGSGMLVMSIIVLIIL